MSVAEEQNKKRVVVKVGTSTLVHPSGALNFHRMEMLSRTLSDLMGMGHEMILVSSGAIGIGTGKLRLPERPKQLRLKQAVAAVGQCEMMHLYDKFFGEYGQTVAQILLTRDDVDDPHRSENLRNTFEALLEMRAIPVVNENDSVSFAEIETGKSKVFGDNDTLSAVVAVLCQADLLVLLSDIDGLYDQDPHVNPAAKLIPVVYAVDDSIRRLAGGSGTCWGTGGMSTKLDAAAICLNSGVDMVITNGADTERLYQILNNHSVGTRFTTKQS
ncbi:MAG: glutamate 5-kinase [Oscillospiraceae bacterium]|nr:glutamate 5-kinase [Oscillospiraceae bacterium]